MPWPTNGVVNPCRHWPANWLLRCRSALVLAKGCASAT
jgi:hypothetical protein